MGESDVDSLNSIFDGAVARDGVGNGRLKQEGGSPKRTVFQKRTEELVYGIRASETCPDGNPHSTEVFFFQVETRIIDRQPNG